MKNYPFINIKTKLPGPKSSKIMKIDEQSASPSYVRTKPFVTDKGEGVTITDVDGNQFLDFCAGIAVCSTGHCHPEIVSTIQKQAGKLIHTAGAIFAHEPLSLLAKKLSAIAPGKSKKKVFFSNSGTEAIEAAIKLARYATGRPLMISYIGAFHGRTMGGISLTASKTIQKKGFSPLLSGVTHIPFPYCYRCIFGRKYGSCNFECFKYLEDTLFNKTVPPSEVAAIFIEPVQGEGGYVIPPIEYMQMLRKLTKKHGILLVADEIQSGMGRTGKMFACEHFKIEPDILCCAKGIASGMPLGAIVAKADIMKWSPGAHASTFGGNPISCAAALKTVELLEKGLVKNSVQMGTRLINGLKKLEKKYKIIGEVRGKGLMIGMEIITDKKTKAKDPKTRDKILKTALHEGLILLGCGPNVIRFTPALVVNKDQIDCCLGIVEKIVKKFSK